MWLSYPIIGNVPLSITPDTVFSGLDPQTTNGSRFCLPYSIPSEVRLHSPAPAWHLDQLILPIFKLKVLKIYIYIYMYKRQAGVEVVLSSPLISPFSIFQGGLERFRGGSVWGLYFCSSPHYPLQKHPLLQKTSVVSPRCLSTRTETQAGAEKYNNAELTRSDSRRLTLWED